MPSRFEYERAIRRSDLPPLARFIALTIATWADAETGAISRTNQPAQSVLLEATGMSKSAFLAHRKTLFDRGWLECESPDRIKAQKEHAQNVYSIHIPEGKAGSGDDLAKAGKRPGKRREPRSGGDLALGREATQPKGTEPAKSGSNLGRQATTRVLPSPSLSSISPVGSGQESSGSEERIPNAFVYIQPLITAMTDAGLTVSWAMEAEDYQSVAQIMRRAGVEAMLNFALDTKASSRKSIRYATFFLRGGWKGLPPKSIKPRASSGAGAAKPPYCGDPDCDEITRLRQREDDNGLRSVYPCPQCHPSRKDSAA